MGYQFERTWAKPSERFGSTELSLVAGAQPQHETALVMALRDGDGAVFMAIVEVWGPAMLRLARAHVSSQAIAEEVVQEAWVGILRALDGFEGRSSLKTWAFRIVANTRSSTSGT